MTESLKQTYRREIRATLALAAPIVVTQLAHVSLSFVDTVMVGRLGPEALAGVLAAGDVLLTLGAGDIGNVASKLVNAFSLFPAFAVDRA